MAQSALFDDLISKTGWPMPACNGVLVFRGYLRKLAGNVNQSPDGSREFTSLDLTRYCLKLVTQVTEIPRCNAFHPLPEFLDTVLNHGDLPTSVFVFLDQTDSRTVSGGIPAPYFVSVPAAVPSVPPVLRLSSSFTPGDCEGSNPPAVCQSVPSSTTAHPASLSR